jgi:hypothetical protein
MQQFQDDTDLVKEGFAQIETASSKSDSIELKSNYSESIDTSLINID